MKKKVISPIIFLIFVGHTILSSQPNPHSENLISGKTSLFFELGGSGWLYSINIDHKIHPYVSLRAGLSAVPSADFSFIGGPVMINALPGWDSHRVEIGAGALSGHFSNNSNEPLLNYSIQPGESRNTIFPALNAGYRYQPLNRNMFFRVAYTPFVTKEGLQHWGGFGIGFTLTK